MFLTKYMLMWRVLSSWAPHFCDFLSYKATLCNNWLLLKLVMEQWLVAARLADVYYCINLMKRTEWFQIWPCARLYIKPLVSQQKEDKKDMRSKSPSSRFRILPLDIRRVESWIWWHSNYELGLVKMTWVKIEP